MEDQLKAARKAGREEGRREILEKLAEMRDEYGIRLATREGDEIFLNEEGQTTFFRCNASLSNSSPSEGGE